MSSAGMEGDVVSSASVEATASTSASEGEARALPCLAPPLVRGLPLPAVVVVARGTGAGAGAGVGAGAASTDGVDDVAHRDDEAPLLFAADFVGDAGGA